MYYIRIISNFSSAHSLRNYPGDCARFHGHNWKVEVFIKSDKLDDSGMIMDFRVLKKYTKEVTNNLDHRFINDVAPFDKLNPTAENICKYIYDILKQRISSNSNAYSLHKVILWENDNASAIYK